MLPKLFLTARTTANIQFSSPVKKQRQKRPSLAGVFTGLDITTTKSSVSTFVPAPPLDLARSISQMMKSTFQWDGSLRARSVCGIETSFTIAMNDAYIPNDYNIFGDIDPDVSDPGLDKLSHPFVPFWLWLTIVASTRLSGLGLTPNDLYEELARHTTEVCELMQNLTHSHDATVDGPSNRYLVETRLRLKHD
jgi:hypothetical protein